jgi:hypothetical protein
MSEHVDGHCYCGEVTYRVSLSADVAPIFTAYCHCDSCRRSHAAALYQVACIDAERFEVTSGKEHIQDFQKPGGRINRAFCRICGTRVYNRFPGWTPGGRTPLVFFPNTLDEATQHDLPEQLRPSRNNRPQECVLDLEMLRPLLQAD